MSWPAILSVTFYVVLLVAMLAYSANAFFLVLVHLRHRRRAPTPPPLPRTRLPRVCVQLPVYNEANVVERLLRAAARLRWPRHLLQIQLLDDSDDDTSDVAARAIIDLAAAGVRVDHIRRTNRRDFKAGALAHGMAASDADFFAVFDADFVPPPDFLERAMPWFLDREVAAVQGRWTHLNRDWSGLTRIQALAIDGHFGVEQAARSWGGLPMNFNGTCGVWRRAAIDDAGGWSGDTLTEDLDLSYRAQLRGWRLAFDPDLTCPGELPTRMSAFKAQQRRWATGSMQCARKLLGPVWRSELSLLAKLEATLHLTHYAVHPLIAATAILSVPCVLIPGLAAGEHQLWALLVPFALAMAGPTLLYTYAQRVVGERWRTPLEDIGLMSLIGIGLAVSNARAVAAAFGTSRGSFVRTPKLGVRRPGERPRRAYRADRDGLRLVEASLAVYCLLAAVGLLWAGVYVVAPFMLLDAAGLGFVAAHGDTG